MKHWLRQYRGARARLRVLFWPSPPKGVRALYAGLRRGDENGRTREGRAVVAQVGCRRCRGGYSTTGGRIPTTVVVKVSGLPRAGRQLHSPKYVNYIAPLLSGIVDVG